MDRRVGADTGSAPELTNEPIEVVAFDFGGVLAEEGFREGLEAIARLNGLDEAQFFDQATAAVDDTGDVVGKADEPLFWRTLHERTGIRGSDQDLREEILKRFILRPWMLRLVKELRSRGYVVAILSDQTQWLDELDGRYNFFKDFHRVFNSVPHGQREKRPDTFPGCSPRVRVRHRPGSFSSTTARATWKGRALKDSVQFITRAASLLSMK